MEIANNRKYVPCYGFWDPGTWGIPKLYWDAFSQEQRIHAICKELWKVISYADFVGSNTDEIASRLKAIEEGQLDPYIIETIEKWFDENQPDIVQAIRELNADVDALNAELGEMFSPGDTVSDNMDAIYKMIGTGFNSSNTIASNISSLKNAHVIADEKLKIRVVDGVNGNDATAHAVESTTDTSAMYATLQKAWDDAIYEGSDVRIYFNHAGTYDVRTRIIAGAVVHLMANANASGAVTINVDSSYESLFFYDSHLNLSGTDRCEITLQTDQQIEAEGSTVWTEHSAFECAELFLIQGSIQAMHTRFDTHVVGRYIQGVFRACEFRNPHNRPALYAVCSILRLEADGSEPNIFANNPEAPTQAAITLYTSILYAVQATAKSEGDMMLAYNYFYDLHSVLMFTSAATWENTAAYAQSGNNLTQYSVLQTQNVRMYDYHYKQVTVPANDHVDENIPYDMTFSVVPYVFTQVQVGSGGIATALGDVSVVVTGRTVNGCTIRVINASNVQQTITVLVKAEI